ncbi:MAG: 1,4-alpha-glucan branching protein GlgB [Clostridia bacterium]|nr:1,4-alpha-glucan branching protein GlgB [Clostridia bacterium]
MSNTDFGSYLFHQGTNYHSYEFLGCMLEMVDGKYQYIFRTWAPNAHSVGLVSDFSGWGEAVPFSRITDNGIWELKYTCDHSLELQPYKFRIAGKNGTHDKGDPYARFSRGGADGASLIFTDRDFKWEDKRWLEHRKKTICNKGGHYMSAPINIYEMHMGSFMRHKEDNRYYTYSELAEILPSYLKQMGYTHVEFLPLQEHPFDGSWGYQVCSFYAPTSRFGTPNEFRHLINSLHKAGIGVIMDWVPAHFPKDEWGLYEFDGAPLYEYQGIDRMESRSWGTRFFDLGREEIQSFLISNAIYFFREFHIDGLRVDAVASMIYLDYDRMPGEWHPNHLGTNENLEATAFLRKLNTAIYGEFPDALMIAEESTSFGGITHPVDEGGLGFNMKWNMGWANDFYKYVQTDPLYRRYHHTALNFPLMYAFKEKYCMPISHDEVVHGKLSFVNKMFGSLEDKFWQARTSLMLMMTYPGKKMLFMGTEYAQFREWDYDNSLEWFMLEYPRHKQFREFVASLNAFYLNNSELWDIDFDEEGFRWLLADEADKNVVAYQRVNKKGKYLTVLLNFSGGEQRVTIPVDKALRLESVFDTGNLSEQQKNVTVYKNDGKYYADITLPPFSGVIYKRITKNKKINV